MMEFLLGLGVGILIVALYWEYSNRLNKIGITTGKVQVGYLQKRSRGRPKKVV